MTVYTALMPSQLLGFPFMQAVSAGFLLFLLVVFVAMIIKRLIQLVRTHDRSRIGQALLWLGLSVMTATVLLSTQVGVFVVLLLSERSGMPMPRGDLVADSFFIGLLIAFVAALINIGVRLASGKSNSATPEHEETFEESKLVRSE